MRCSITDGVVTIRPSTAQDSVALVAGRDEMWERFLGPGDPQPRPTACIVVRDAIVGWVDYDTDRTWLQPGEVNVGYNVFAAYRGKGYASRAVQLLMHHLSVDTEWRTATLLIDPANDRSLALARRLRFARQDDLDGNPYWKRPVPPMELTDGVVTIRPGRETDPGVIGPKWSFAVDASETRDVAWVECDLADDRVPHGEASLSCTSYPDHRGRGYSSRAVGLALRFLRDNTGAREAHIAVDGQTMMRFVSTIDDSSNQ